MTPLKRLAFGGAWFTLACLAAGGAVAGPIEDLSASLQGRTGEAKVEQRQEKTVLRVFGHDFKGGCSGVGSAAKVKITTATGKLAGDTAAMDVAYDGTYEKTPCSSADGAAETKRLFGHYLFNVTSKPFQKLQVSPGNLAPGFGTASDPQDESNRLAVEAVQSAIAGAF